MICQTWTIGKAIRALFADRVTYILQDVYEETRISSSNHLLLLMHTNLVFAQDQLPYGINYQSMIFFP